jgi:hypothetical protein
MDTHRLANVIFDRGQKINQTQYQFICESIDSDRFTLNEYVLDYKIKEKFVNRIAYKLGDGTKVLVSEENIRNLNALNNNKKEVEAFMFESYANFKKVIEVLANGNH